MYDQLRLCQLRVQYPHSLYVCLFVCSILLSFKFWDHGTLTDPGFSVLDTNTEKAPSVSSSEQAPTSSEQAPIKFRTSTGSFQVQNSPSSVSTGVIARRDAPK